MGDMFWGGIVDEWFLGDSQSKRLLWPSVIDCKTNRTHFGHGKWGNQIGTNQEASSLLVSL